MISYTGNLTGLLLVTPWNIPYHRKRRNSRINFTESYSVSSQNVRGWNFRIQLAKSSKKETGNFRKSHCVFPHRMSLGKGKSSQSSATGKNSHRTLRIPYPGRRIGLLLVNLWNIPLWNLMESHWVFPHRISVGETSQKATRYIFTESQDSSRTPHGFLCWKPPWITCSKWNCEISLWVKLYRTSLDISSHNVSLWISLKEMEFSLNPHRVYMIPKTLLDCCC